MTLANKLRQKLNEAPPADARHDFNVADDAGQWSLYVTAERRDAWTTVAWEFSLRRAQGNGDVAAWARHIADSASGLLEPLRVVEVDAQRNQALLRSNPPSERDGKLFYYEVVLQGTSSALARRYEGAHTSGKREQVAYALTNEVLVSFVGVLTDEPK